ncbi:MAG: tetratricopeptide repeat protein, partial [Myxococcota bacterium]
DDPRAALAAFEAARSYSDGPLDAEARFGQGEAMHRLGRLRSARRAWRSLIERHPRSAPAKRAQARLESP